MNLTEKLWHLENFNLFKLLSLGQKMKLAKRASMRKFNKDQPIFLPGDESNQLYFLKNGSVKISNFSADGKEVIHSIIRKGEIFGELAAISDAEREQIAVGIKAGILCSLNVEDLKKFMIENHRFNLQITKIIGFRMRKVESRIESLYFKTAPNRIKSFIVELANDYGVAIQQGKEVELSLTHNDIANLTATSRQTVTAVLNQMEKSGDITYDRKKIIVYTKLKDKEAVKNPS